MRFLKYILFSLIFFSINVSAVETGTIHLYCKPKVRIYLDGELVGITNKSDSGIIIKNVPHGEHKIRIQKKGKSTEVLPIYLSNDLLEFESDQFEIGKFSKEIRKSKLYVKGDEKVDYSLLDKYDKVSSWEQISEALRTEYDSFYNTLEINHYIPLIDEKYDVDSLPKIKFIKYPIFPITDSIPTIEFEEVWVKGLIDPLGIVDTVVILGSCGKKEFDILAISAAYKTEYYPAIKDNKKVWVWVSWKIPYRDVYIGEKKLNGEDVERVFNQIYSDTILSQKIKNDTNNSNTLRPEPLDELPVVVRREPPRYPLELLSAGIEGTVWIKGLVSSSGDVVQANVGISSGNAVLDSAAVKAAYGYYFIPGELDGKPVDAVIAWDIVFDKKNAITEEPEGADENLPPPDKFVPVDIMPEMIYQAAPNYPRAAKQKGLQGVVWVKALVDKKGIVKKARVGKSSGHKVLDKAAVEAAFSNKFKPAVQNSRPVNVWVTYKVNFRLNN